MIDEVTGTGMGISWIAGIGGIFANRKSQRQLEKLIGQDPQYTANPIAAQRMGLAQTLLNARMPGAAAAERNIYQSQANMMSNVNRNATDASQALAMAAAGQGQANQGFSNLATHEAQDYQRRYGNLVQAQQGQIQEGDKVFQDQVRRYEDLAAIRGAQAHNRAAMWQGLANMGSGMMAAGASMNSGGGGGGGMGSMGSMFGGMMGGGGAAGGAAGGAGSAASAAVFL